MRPKDFFLFLLLVVLMSLLAVNAFAQGASANETCPTCRVTSNIDTVTVDYVDGWGFGCGTGSTLTRFDVYHYGQDGTLHRLVDAYMTNGLWREDVYNFFLTGGCPHVPVNSGLRITFPTPVPAGDTIIVVLWEGMTSSIQYVSVPLHHNIPTMLPDGTSGWLCETQRRPYTSPSTGATEWTLDHYVVMGRGGCPAIPIR